MTLSRETLRELPDLAADAIPSERTTRQAALNLPTLLRVIGSAVIIAATGLFLFQRWNGGDDLHRYLLLFAYTLTLTGLGFATRRLLHEPKSARLFIALGLVAISTTITVLGALIYAHFGLTDLTTYPDALHWQGVQGRVLALTAIGSGLLMFLQAGIGFLVLARPAAVRLSALFALNAALLLIPIRDPMFSLPIALFAAILGLREMARLGRRHLALRTLPGYVARTLVLLPLAIMVGRGAYLYAADAVAIASLGLLIYLTLRQLAQPDAIPTRWRHGLWLAATFPAGVTALAVSDSIHSMAGLGDAWVPPLAGLLMIGGVLDLHHLDGREDSPYPTIGISVALGVAILELWFWPGFGTAILAIALGLATAFVARRLRRNSAMQAALAVTALGAIKLGTLAYLHFHLGSAFALAAVGIALVFGAALVERR